MAALPERVQELARSVERTRSESRASEASSPGRVGARSVASAEHAPSGDRRAQPSSATPVSVELPEVAVRDGQLYMDGKAVQDTQQKVRERRELLRATDSHRMHSCQSSNGMDVFDVVIHHLLSLDSASPCCGAEPRTDCREQLSWKGRSSSFPTVWHSWSAPPRLPLSPHPRTPPQSSGVAGALHRR